MRQIGLAAATLCVLSGCALLAPPATRPSAVDGVIAEAVLASRAPALEQKSALQRAEQAMAADPAPINQLRLATFLATFADPLRDDARAAQLLEPIANAAEPGVGRFAALLASQVAERRRAAREAERLARERERADKERDKREEALKQQLDALRAIERGIMEREERLRRRTN
jgi:hypothetical protein